MRPARKEQLQILRQRERKNPTDENYWRVKKLIESIKKETSMN